MHKGSERSDEGCVWDEDAPAAPLLCHFSGIGSLRSSSAAGFFASFRPARAERNAKCKASMKTKIVEKPGTRTASATYHQMENSTAIAIGMILRKAMLPLAWR